jgi:hypothetical protein
MTEETFSFMLSVPFTGLPNVKHSERQEAPDSRALAYCYRIQMLNRSGDRRMEIVNRCH